MKPDDHLDYYEIDAEVIPYRSGSPNALPSSEIAKPDANIVLGDARLTIADATDARYDVIVVDAFSSDSIPVHLLTREATANLSVAAQSGWHHHHAISNHHLD